MKRMARFLAVLLLAAAASGALAQAFPVRPVRFIVPFPPGGGSIINVTSHLGLIGSVKPAYAATKGGIVAFTKTLAAQYVQYNIRANAIAPGSIRTERQIKRYENKDYLLAEKPGPAARARMLAKKRYPFASGEPGDIAEIGVFLASDDSRMLTGTTIAADGGRSSYQSFETEEN